MTASDLISNLRQCGPQSLSVILHYIADRVYEAELPNGAALRDATDFKAWLVDLADEARNVDGMEIPGETENRPAVRGTRRLQQPRWDRTCPDCDHEHEGRNDCGKYLGEGKFCQCESKVTA
jgi:hypothetical protein